jgi:peptidoglycan/LPS O-acetylase OafA/YrhL
MALAVVSFYIFSDIRISSKIINRISRRTLGVYLIHTHFIGFSILVAKILPWIEENEQQLRVIPFVMIVLLVFVVACCVDAVVEWVIEKPLIGFIKKYMDKPINKINQWMRELV